MSDFITILIIGTIVSLPHGFDHQTQSLQPRDPEQIQFFESREFLVSLKPRSNKNQPSQSRRSRYRRYFSQTR